MLLILQVETRERFLETSPFLQVVGVPVTLSGDLKNQFVETTVGFDTVCKVIWHISGKAAILNSYTIYKCHDISLKVYVIIFFQVNSQLISNVCLDAVSAGKVY
jgi:pyrophosphate--fructose-6-phosphate 1-phosphotransferase